MTEYIFPIFLMILSSESIWGKEGRGVTHILWGKNLQLSRERGDKIWFVCNLRHFEILSVVLYFNPTLFTPIRHSYWLIHKIPGILLLSPQTPKIFVEKRIPYFDTWHATNKILVYHFFCIRIKPSLSPIGPSPSQPPGPCGGPCFCRLPLISIWALFCLKLLLQETFPHLGNKYKSWGIFKVHIRKHSTIIFCNFENL